MEIRGVKKLKKFIQRKNTSQKSTNKKERNIDRVPQKLTIFDTIDESTFLKAT